MSFPLLLLKRAIALALLLSAVIYAHSEEAGAKTAPFPLSIEKAEELARVEADQVVATRAAAMAALRAADSARAAMLPKLSGSLSGAYLVNPPKGKGIDANTIPVVVTDPQTGHHSYGKFPPVDLTLIPDAKSTYFKGNMTFTQPLFAWGKIRAAIDLAALEASLTEADAQGAALDAGRQANRAYYSALLSRRSSAVLAELRDFAAQIVADRDEAMKTGFSTKADVLSSKADLADLESRIVEAREGESSSLEALAMLTGLEPGSIELSSDFREALPAIAEEGLKGQASESSTAFKEARLRLAEAKRKLDLDRGSTIFKPDLSFFASLDASGQGSPFSSGAWSDDYWSWDLSLGIAAKADFFDGGAAAARTKEAAAKVEAATAALGAAGKAARLEARRALETGRKAQAALAASLAREEWAAEALRNAKASSGADLISRAQLNGAAIREASARLEVLGARYALEEAIADLDRIGAGAAR